VDSAGAPLHAGRWHPQPPRRRAGGAAREIRRRRQRRDKTHKLKVRIEATADNKLKAKLTEKLKRINPHLQNIG